jgi:hypothetical protein
MQWLRVHHDLENEPKIRLVAVESGQIEAIVLAVWLRMMICASKSVNRGTLEGWDDRLVGVTLGLKGQIVTEIRQAMQGVLLDGDALTGWDKRQRAGSDDAAERKRKSRAKKAQEATKTTDSGGHGGNGADPEGHAPVTGQSRDKAAHGHVTSANSHVTPSTRVDSQITEDSVASATGAEAPEPPTILDTIYRECLTWLVKTSGTPEKTIRTRIGKWRQNWSDGTVLEAITIAQAKAREGHLSQPLTYIGGILKNRVMKNGQQANGSKHDDLANGLAGAFIDQLDPGSANFSGDGGAVARRYH